MPNLRNLKILFVEDEENVRINIKEAIGEEFLSFDTACDGLDGLEKFKQINPDVVITDISMPNLDGLKMSSEIRKLSLRVPIIILSAFSEKEKLFKAIDSNVNKYIVKPIDIDELLETIDEIVSRNINKQELKLAYGYSFNEKNKELFLNGNFISLTKKELIFIDILIDNKESYAKKNRLYKYVWDNKTSETAVRTFVQRLRNKTSKELIQNVSGLGYKIAT